MSCGAAVPIRYYSVALFMSLYLVPEQHRSQVTVWFRSFCPIGTGQSSQAAITFSGLGGSPGLMPAISRPRV